jgi:hypothetical protein
LDSPELTGHETLELFHLAFAGRVVLEELVGETECSEGQADCVANLAVAGKSKFATASAEIDQQDAVRAEPSVGDNAEVNETGFFES